MSDKREEKNKKLKDEVGSMVNVEDRWQVLKEVVIASTEKNVGYQNAQTARKQGITDAMISKMEE